MQRLVGEGYTAKAEMMQAEQSLGERMAIEH